MIIDLAAIHPAEVPDEGIRLSGEIEGDIFQLDEASIRTSGGVRYDGHLSVVSDTLLFLGSISADFDLECVRCLERFIFRVSLEGHALQAECGESGTIDLTSLMREDILLALPAYPKCEEGLSERTCPAEGKFPASDQYEIHDEGESRRKNVWGALDELEDKND